MPAGNVGVPPVTLLPLAVVPRAVCHYAARRRRRAACRRCRAACHPVPLARAARRRRRAASSCRPSPFVFLGGQSEELDLTKAQ